MRTGDERRAESSAPDAGHAGRIGVTGLAVHSENPAVRDLLARVFPESTGHPGVFIADGPDMFTQLHDVLSVFSVLENQTIRAAPLTGDGRYDPWSAEPVLKMLERFETPWLRDLLESGSLDSHFQPIVESGSLRVHGFETLVRSAGAHVGRTPGEMIHAARAHDVLHRFDRCAQHSAIRAAARKLLPTERLFINLFPMTIYDPEASLRSTLAIAERAGIAFERLVFEVVESEQFPDISHLGAILAAYRRAGARVALDDLGAGNTALNYIEQLEPNYIKIDRQLIASAVRRDTSAMLEGLVRHAHHAGITVIAEGIETTRELELVRSFGVDLLQGWAIARPQPEPCRQFDPRLRSEGANPAA